VKEILGDRNQLNTGIDELRAFSPDVVVDFIVSSGLQAEDLIGAFRGITRRIVMLSSIDVYRAVGIFHGTETGALQQLPLTEESELRRNLHPYPREGMQRLREVFSWLTDDYDKIPAERVVMSDRDIAGTVLRLPMIYGPGDPLRRFNPIVQRIRDGRRHIIFSDTQAEWRCPRGYVENVAAAISLASVDERSAGRIYNVCETPSFSELEWARKIAACLNWDGEFVMMPTQNVPSHLLTVGNFSQRWTASSSRIRQELGYQEPVEVDEAIRRTAQWESENAPLSQFDYAAEDAALVR
jgi:nucleoside-diphosphate-sugar epimerase